MYPRALLGALLLLVMAAQPAGGQRITGTVVRTAVGPSANAVATVPISSAVVLLLADTRDSVIARGVTAPNGRFLLQAPGAGTYRVRVLRIGQRPLVQGPWRVGASETLDVVIAAVEQPVQLARFDVRADGVCRREPDSRTLAGQLLGDARTAFLSSVSSTADGERQAVYRFFRYDRDRRGRLEGDSTSELRKRQTARPFASLSPDSIAKVGYVVDEGDSVTYRGPDAEVLLSESFARSHCFHVVEGVGSRSGMLGVVFRPVNPPAGVVDISGTIWMDPGSLRVNDVEFVYDPASREERQMGIGGVVRFASTADGTWLVREWELRMPRVRIRRTAPVLSGRPAPARIVRDLIGTQVFGGVVMQVAGQEVLFADTAQLAGEANRSKLAARDSAANRRTVRHEVCGPISGPLVDLSVQMVGVVEGRLLDAEGTVLADVLIRAEWRSDFRLGTDDRLTFRNRAREARTQGDGRFVLCELPYDVPVIIRAVAAGDRTMTQRTVRLADMHPVDTIVMTAPRLPGNPLR